MHKIKAWAHNAAHKNNYNPWAAEKFGDDVHGYNPGHDYTRNELTLEVGIGENQGDPNNKQQQDLQQHPSGSHGNGKKSLFQRFIEPFQIIMFHSWINLLLVFVPAGIAVHFAGINPNVVFALNAIAVIPLAGLLTFATESVAHRLGPTLGALMNVSFGNAVELIIFIIALVKNEIRIVQASLIGSILANLLLILGMALFIGGLEFQEQVYDSIVTQMSAALLCVASLSLLIPTAFHASFSDLSKADDAVLPMSRGTSVILLLVYVLYLLFQLKSHSYLYQGTPQHIIDSSTQPGILQRLDSSSEGTSSSSSVSLRTTSSVGSSGARRRVKKKLRTKLGMRRKTKTEEIDVTEESDPDLIQPVSPAPARSITSIRQKEEDVADVSQSLQGPRTEPALTTAVNVSQPNSPPANQKRPLIPTRGLTIRPPPVFRNQTHLTATQSPIQQHHYQLPAAQLRRLHSTPNMIRSDGSGDRALPVIHNTRHNLHPSGTETSNPPKPLEETVGEPPISQTTAIILLLVSTGLVALCAEFLVSAIDHLVANSPLSEAFVGLIILPIVGNAAEHVTAVTVAAKNKLDLSMGVSLGSSIQIALFVTPLVVILGWILDKEMSLYFTLFETVALFVSVFIVNFLVLDGRSNFLEGALLCACYVIIALGTYYYPDDQDASVFVGGTGTNSTAS